MYVWWWYPSLIHYLKIKLCDSHMNYDFSNIFVTNMSKWCTNLFIFYQKHCLKLKMIIKIRNIVSANWIVHFNFDTHNYLFNGSWHDKYKIAKCISHLTSTTQNMYIMHSLCLLCGLLQDTDQLPLTWDKQKNASKQN